jgi:hypothetical protein
MSPELLNELDEFVGFLAVAAAPIAMTQILCA